MHVIEEHRIEKTKYRLYLSHYSTSWVCFFGAAYLVANSSVSEDANLSTMKDLMTSKYGSFKFGSWCSYDVFDYKGLSREASTIALVTSKDTLSDSMSNGIGTGGGLEGDIYYNTFSLRTVDVIEYYRNNEKYGDTFRISERVLCFEIVM